MYRSELIIDVYSESFIIYPLITERIEALLNEYHLKEFNVKWDLLELDVGELYRQIDSHRAKDGMYFYNGVQYSFEELEKYFVKNLRRFVLKVQDLGEKNESVCR